MKLSPVNTLFFLNHILNRWFLIEKWFSALSRLKCTKCGKIYNPDEVNTTCPECGGVLYAEYDYEAAKETLTWDSLSRRPASLGLWRYFEILPVRERRHVVHLGEGLTPLFKAEGLARIVGLRSLYVKDESFNPTGTFKARGVAVALSKAIELGIRKFGMPSAGNAGAALAAYSAKAGVEAVIYAPKSTPKAMITEMRAYGARLELVEGSISDAAKAMRERERGVFDLTTMKEPYRVEGKKTMGLELVEQLGEVPDVVIYPTGGGTGLLGIWKGIQELRELGLLKEEKAPRMVAVQSVGCDPVVKAFREGRNEVVPPAKPETLAAGIRVPKPYADYLILKVIRESGGTAISVTDDEILEAVKEVSKMEGILPCPEGAATYAGLKKLVSSGWVGKDETVVLINTGSGLKYMDVYLSHNLVS